MSVSGSVMQKSYAFLNDSYSQPPQFIPFKQGILEGGYGELDPKWAGSCAYLTMSWMCQKMISDNILAPTAFQLENKEIIVLGDNAPQGMDLQRMQKLFNKAFDRIQGRILMYSEQVEEKYNCKGIEALMAHFERKRLESDRAFIWNRMLNYFIAIESRVLSSLPFLFLRLNTNLMGLNGG